MAGIGGIIRDHQGLLAAACVGCLATNTPLEADLHALLKVVKLGQNLGHRLLLKETAYNTSRKSSEGR